MTTQDPQILDNDESKDPAWYRETIARQKAESDAKDVELAKLRAEKRDRVLAEAGLSPIALKAVQKDIERGDYEGEMTPEAVQGYAQTEYDWQPEGAGDPPPVDENTQRRIESQQARDDVHASSAPRGEPDDDTPESTQKEIDEKLEAGDVDGAILTELTSKVGRAQ